MKTNLALVCAAFLGRSNIGCLHASKNLGPVLAEEAFKADRNEPHARMSFNTIVYTICADVIEGDNDSMFTEEASGWIKDMEGIDIIAAVALYPTLNFYLEDWLGGKLKEGIEPASF